MSRYKTRIACLDRAEKRPADGETYKRDREGYFNQVACASAWDQSSSGKRRNRPHKKDTCLICCIPCYNHAVERKVIYFEKTGKENTSACLDVVKQAVNETGYKHLVVATTGGDTGLLFSEALKSSDINLVVVTHSAGFKEPNTSEISDDIKKKGSSCFSVGHFISL